jgi:hypothetical protein
VPNIVDAILGGQQPAALQLDVLIKWFPLVWRLKHCPQHRQALRYMRKSQLGVGFYFL